MNSVASRARSIPIRSQRRKPNTSNLERVASSPQQLRLESLLAQVLEIVEVQLERALVPSKLSSERAEMIEATCEQGRKPTPYLVLGLVELDRQIDITDVKRATRVGTEDPYPPHAREIAPFAARHAAEEPIDPLRRLRAPHHTQRRPTDQPSTDSPR
jgi:hypothetical protein